MDCLVFIYSSNSISWSLFDIRYAYGAYCCRTLGNKAHRTIYYVYAAFIVQLFVVSRTTEYASCFTSLILYRTFQHTVMIHTSKFLVSYLFSTWRSPVIPLRRRSQCTEIMERPHLLHVIFMVAVPFRPDFVAEVFVDCHVGHFFFQHVGVSQNRVSPKSSNLRRV